MRKTLPTGLEPALAFSVILRLCTGSHCRQSETGGSGFGTSGTAPETVLARPQSVPSCVAQRSLQPARSTGFSLGSVLLIKVRRKIFTKSRLTKFVDKMKPESNLFTVSAVRGARSLRIHLRATLIGPTTLAFCWNNSASHQCWKWRSEPCPQPS